MRSGDVLDVRPQFWTEPQETKRPLTGNGSTRSLGITIGTEETWEVLNSTSLSWIDVGETLASVVASPLRTLTVMDGLCTFHPIDLKKYFHCFLSSSECSQRYSVGCTVTEKGTAWSIWHHRLAFELFLEASYRVDTAKKFVVMSYPPSLIQILRIAL